MTQRIAVLVEHLEGQPTDVTFELLGLARRIANTDGASVQAYLLVSALDTWPKSTS